MEQQMYFDKAAAMTSCGNTEEEGEDLTAALVKKKKDRGEVFYQYMI